MMKYLAPILALGILTAAAAPGQPPLRLERLVRLPASDAGGFDHLGFDASRGRAFLTAKDQHALLVVDARRGRILQTIHALGRPHAVLYRDDADRLFVTDGADGAVKVFDGSSYRLQASIALRADADSIGYDPSTQWLYVDNGGKDAHLAYSFVSAIDTTSLRRVGEVRVPSGTLEAMALDRYRPRLYVNDPEHNSVVVIDRWARRIIADWPVTLGRDNVAIALDEAHERLFVACRSGVIVVFDSTTGRELQAIPSLKGIDDLTFDPAARRLYAAGDGAVAAYRQRDADHYAALPLVAAGPGATTGLLLPQRSTYLTVVPQHGAQEAALAILRTDTTWKDPAPSAPFAYAPHAPAAERLVMRTLSRHPFLRKLGLHGIAPGHTVSVLLANGNATRRGIETTPGDFAAVKSGAFYGPLIADGSFYNVKLQLFDASNRRIGLVVMEIPASAAPNRTAAMRTAFAIRREVSAQIPDLKALFAP
jgi:hypothetical protein